MQLLPTDRVAVFVKLVCSCVFQKGCKVAVRFSHSRRKQASVRICSCRLLRFWLCLWAGTVLKLGTKKHHDLLVGQIDSLAATGCFALTELGFGALLPHPPIQLGLRGD